MFRRNNSLVSDQLLKIKRVLHIPCPSWSHITVVNGACHPGDSYWDYYPDALSLSQVIVARLKNGYLQIQWEISTFKCLMTCQRWEGTMIVVLVVATRCHASIIFPLQWYNWHFMLFLDTGLGGPLKGNIGIKRFEVMTWFCGLSWSFAIPSEVKPSQIDSLP